MNEKSQPLLWEFRSSIVSELGSHVPQGDMAPNRESGMEGESFEPRLGQQASDAIRPHRPRLEAVDSTRAWHCLIYPGGKVENPLMACSAQEPRAGKGGNENSTHLDPESLSRNGHGYGVGVPDQTEAEREREFNSNPVPQSLPSPTSGEASSPVGQKTV